MISCTHCDSVATLKCSLHNTPFCSSKCSFQHPCFIGLKNEYDILEDITSGRVDILYSTRNNKNHVMFFKLEDGKYQLLFFNYIPSKFRQNFKILNKYEIEVEDLAFVVHILYTRKKYTTMKPDQITFDEFENNRDYLLMEGGGGKRILIKYNEQGDMSNILLSFNTPITADTIWFFNEKYRDYGDTIYYLDDYEIEFPPIYLNRVYEHLKYILKKG